MRRLPCLLLFLLMPLTAQAATTRYASNAGSGSTCTSSVPCSLSTGMSATVAGDTLYLKAGTYTQPIGQNSSGPDPASGTSNAARVTIAKDPAAASRSVIIRPSSSAFRALDLSSSSRVYRYLTFDGLVFDAINVPFETAKVAGDHIRIQNCVLTGGIGGILGLGDDGEFLTNEVHHTRGTRLDHGVYVGGHRNIFDGNVVHHNTGWGFHLYDGTSNDCADNIFRNNVVYDNNTSAQDGVGILIGCGANNAAYNNIVYSTGLGPRQYGIQVANGATSNNQLYQNTIYGNQSSAIALGSPSSTLIKNNILWGNDSNSVALGSASGTVQDHNSSVNPGFKSLAGGAEDFHIALAGSPVVAAAPLLPAVLKDAEGNTRVDPTTIGAYEFAPGEPPPQPPPPGLRVELKGNGSFSDTSGNAKNGTAEGGMLANGTPIIQPYTSFVFDGVNDDILISEDIGFRPTDVFCISAWLNSTDANDAYLWDVAGSYGFWHDAAGLLHGYIMTAAGLVGVQSSASVINGQSTHVVYTKTPMGLYLYVNGTNPPPNFIPTAASVVYSGTPAVRIGRNGALAQEYFAGRMGHIRFYNDKCDAAAVQNLYSEQVSVAGLAATAWRFYTADAAEGTPIAGYGENALNIPVNRSGKVRMRWALQRAGVSINEYIPLACNLNGGTFARLSNSCAASPFVCIAPDSQKNMGDATASLLSLGGFTFTPGVFTVDTINSAFTTPMADGQQAEEEYALAFGSGLANNDVVRCKPTRTNDADLDGLPATLPTITIVAPMASVQIKGGRIQ